MRKLFRLAVLPAMLALFIGSATGAFGDNVCPVIKGGEIKGTPAEVPDKTGNPAHGTQDENGPVNPGPGDVFWN